MIPGQQATDETRANPSYVSKLLQIVFLKFNKDSKFLGIQMPKWVLEATFLHARSCAIFIGVNDLSYWDLVLHALSRQKTWPAHVASERRLSCGFIENHA